MSQDMLTLVIAANLKMKEIKTILGKEKTSPHTQRKGPAN